MRGLLETLSNVDPGGLIVNIKRTYIVIIETFSDYR